MDQSITEILQKALSDHAGAIKSFTEKAEARHATQETRLIELEQKLVRRGSGPVEGQHRPGDLADLLMKSDGLAAFKSGNSPRVEISVPATMFKAAIMNATGASQPLVAADRRPGIVVQSQRRFTIRDLFAAIPTNSNSVEFARELVFTNNAGPQGGGSSPEQSEGQRKPESGITFELVTTPVITIAHWIPASKQVLEDAAALQQHVEQRLLYGLKLEEEDELLNGTNTNGELNGLIRNAVAFSGGSTNATALDVVARGIAQLIATDHEPTGIVLNPQDWWGGGFMLAKNSQGDYLLGNPGEMTEPRLWGLPVVVTNAMPFGNFLTLDPQRVGYIADRDNASVLISTSHDDYFVRNLVAILCEERLGLVLQRPSAMVYGGLNYAG